MAHFVHEIQFEWIIADFFNCPSLGSPLFQQSRGFPGKMMGGQLKRPAPPLGEHSVIQHAPPPPLHHPAPPSEDCPSPSKRTRGSSSEQVRGHTFGFLLGVLLCVLLATAGDSQTPERFNAF